MGADGKPGPGTYTIFLGGRTIGDRLSLEFKDYVPHDRVVAELIPVFQQFKTDRHPGESFGEYCAGLASNGSPDSLPRPIPPEARASVIIRRMAPGRHRM